MSNLCVQVWKRALCNTKLFFVFLLNSPYNNTLRLCLFWLQITSRNTDVWLCMENKFSGNYFQLTMCFEGFDLEMVWSENFHFKPFPAPCGEREREREREREWYYILIWQLRKCEHQVENVFFIVFSRTQPNTRKYFLKHFLKCNQTHENIFLSRK